MIYRPISSYIWRNITNNSWKEKDLAPFAAMNADEKVMEFFPTTFDFEESKDFAAKYKKKQPEIFKSS